MKLFRLARWFQSLAAWLLMAVTASGQSPGSVDPTFQPPTIGFGVSRVALQADGKVLVGGGLRPDGKPEPRGVLRFHSDGMADSSFDIGTGFIGATLVLPGVFTNVAQPIINALAATPAGTLVGGAFEKVAGLPRTNLVRLLTNGAVDPVFAPLVDGQLLSITPLAGGKMLIGGGFKKVNGTAQNQLARLNSDGSLDTSFTLNWGSLIPGSIRTLVVQDDGKILVGGSFLVLSNFSAKAVVRLNADGSVDASFTPAALQFTTESVSSLVVQADGKIIAVGGFKQIAGNARQYIARLDASGVFDATWPGPGAGTLGFESISSIAAAPNGQWFIGGGFATYNGQAQRGIARLNADGSLDTTFKNPVGSTTFTVSALAVQPNGDAIVGGVFTLGTTADSTKLLLRLTATAPAPPEAPKVTKEPLSVTANEGGTAAFMVEASGTPPLAYQWQRNGQNLQFKNEATLNFPALKLSDTGDYRVIVSNAAGSATSIVATLTVLLSAKFTVEPVSVAAGVGSTATLTAEVTGTPPVTFQWFKNNTLLSGATNPSLTFIPLQLTDADNYYLVARNAAGAVTSRVVHVTVYPSTPSWIVTSADDGLGTLDDLWSDGIGGVLVAGRYTAAASGNTEFTLAGQTLPRPQTIKGAFVARFDDTGALKWVRALEGDANVEFNQLAVAADASGNVFVAGGFNGIATLSGVKFTNTTAKATFLAKLDVNGLGLWAQVLTGDLISRQLAVDADGHAILSGRHTTELRLPGLIATANEFGSGAVAKISSGGLPQWLRSWRKGGTVGGAVDIYQVAADAAGLYVAGAFSQSIQFGAFSANVLNPPFRDLRWVGKLDTDGNPVWLQPYGGGIPTGLSTGRDGSLWVSGYDDALAGTGQVVGRANASTGTFTTNYVFGRSQGTVISQGISVDDQNHALTGGHFFPTAQFGSTIMGLSIPGDGGLFTARFTSAGETRPALQTARNFLSGGVASEIFISAFTGNLAGDGYYVGHFKSALRFGTNSLNAAARRVFIAKVAGPGRLPYFIQQPVPVSVPPGSSATFTATAGGDPTLAYQWLKNGAPIPGATGATLTFNNVTATNVANYSVVVANARGSITSDSPSLTLGTPPIAPIIGQPMLVSGGKITFTLATQSGVTYALQTRTSLATGAWGALQTIPGDGSTKTLEVAVAGQTEFFRVVVGP